MSLISEDAAAHPGAVLGPRLVTAYCLGLETGILLNLFYRYWKDCPPNTSKLLRLVVGFEMALAAAQTALAYHAVYYVLVTHFADWDAVVDLRWTGRLQSLLIFCIAGIIKAAFIFRCWSVLARKPYTLSVLATLYAANEALALYTVVQAFRAQASISPSVDQEHNTLVMHIAYAPVFIAKLVFTAVLDIVIAFILLSSMPRTSFRFYPRYPITSLYRLISLFWDAFLAPSVFSIIALITYLTLTSESFWSDLFQDTLGQIYIMSLFAFLNSSQRQRKKAFSNGLGSGGQFISWRRRSNVSIVEDGFEAADASRGSGYELEPMEQATASDGLDDLTSREALSLSIPEKATIRRHRPV